MLLVFMLAFTLEFRCDFDSDTVSLERAITRQPRFAAESTLPIQLSYHGGKPCVPRLGRLCPRTVSRNSAGWNGGGTAT